MNSIICLSDAITVVEKVSKSVNDILAPVCVKNRGQWNSYNHIEIYNSGSKMVKKVNVDIKEFLDGRCKWKHPNNLNERKLVIPYIEPNGHKEHELLYAYSGDGEDVHLQISWEDWLGIKHSDTQCLHLEGL